MSKFLKYTYHGDMINTDLIAFIQPDFNGCTILTKDGQQLHSELDLIEKLEDEAEVRAVVPCHGIGALYYFCDGRTEIKPCPLAYLLSDGSLEPVEFTDHDDIEEFADTGATGFVGFVPMP